MKREGPKAARTRLERQLEQEAVSRAIARKKWPWRFQVSRAKLLTEKDQENLDALDQIYGGSIDCVELLDMVDSAGKSGLLTFEEWEGLQRRLREAISQGWRYE